MNVDFAAYDATLKTLGLFGRQAYLNRLKKRFKERFMEEQAIYQSTKRDCDTCFRTKPGTQVCTMSNTDIDTCLGNPSRPFWRGVGKASQEFLRTAWQNPVSCSRGREDDPTPITPDTGDLIRDECQNLQDLLLEKNRKYGDAAIHPVRLFSRANPVEQINVRIDDKLSRIRSAQGDDLEDAEQDLLGYLVLKRVAKRVRDDI
jgi:hypothetical protein